VDGVFSVPVTEAYPEVTEAYHSVIKEPMDFRTIEQCQLQRYKSIRDLQRDLRLIFNNCLVFNQESNSELVCLAR